jgi:hypothetical protein
MSSRAQGRLRCRGNWAFLIWIENSAIPNPVASRKYPVQCGSVRVGKRREVRGSLGLTDESF